MPYVDITGAIEFVFDSNALNKVIGVVNNPSVNSNHFF